MGPRGGRVSRTATIPTDRRPIGFWLKLVQRKPTTRPVVDDLCARGWAAWSSGDPANLTQAGATAHAALLAKVSSSRRQVTAGITPDDYLATVEVLRRMAANLGWDDPGGGPSR